MEANLIKTIAVRWVQKYRKNAHNAYLQGQRPYYLPCEEILEGHCAKLFEEDLQRDGFIFSLRQFIKRCPKGYRGATMGLLGGLIVWSGLTAFQSSSEQNCNSCLDGCQQCSDIGLDCSSAGKDCGQACSI